MVRRLPLVPRASVVDGSGGCDLAAGPAQVVAAPAEVERARRWVAGLQANGGTEMLGALTLALEGDAGEQAVRQVVFMTDGQVGNEDQLFRFIHERLGRSRLFTVGIGASPNAHFMTKAAQFGRGTYTYIGSPTEVAEKMGALFRKLERPVLADVAVDWRGRADVEAWPARVPDLYAGEPLMLVARNGREALALTLASWVAWAGTKIQCGDKPFCGAEAEPWLLACVFLPAAAIAVFDVIPAKAGTQRR